MALGSSIPFAFLSARASDFPSRPIRIVVGFAPGGSTDAIARDFARRLEKEIGQSVLIDNKPGGYQIIAVQSALSGGADGYSLVIGTPGSLSITPNLYKSLPYDPRALVPVAPLTTQATALVALPSFPASSFSELVSLAKSRKTPLNYGSLGSGSSVHLAMEMLKSRAGMDIQHIAYRGDAPALLALQSREVELGAITMFSALPRVRRGELKALGVFQAKPDPGLPQVQTTAQAGFPEIDFPSWLGLFAPPKTPKDVIDKLEAASRRVLASADFATYLASVANEPLAISNQALVSMAQTQTQRFREVIDSIGLKPE